MKEASPTPCMTERELIIEECKAALCAAGMGWEYDCIYESVGCPTCAAEKVDGLRNDDICKVLDKLKTNPIKRG